MHNVVAKLLALLILVCTTGAAQAHVNLRNGDLRNVALDGKGNVTEIRRFNGTVVASYGYGPFGQVLFQTNTYNQPFRFSTRLYHDRSGFIYMIGRWYDPATGRFLSRDPIQENGGINLYEAFAGNPVNNIDPDGRVVETIVDVASIGWSAVDLWRNPSWGNAGFLAWDVGAAIVPFVPGSYVAKGAKLAGKAKKCALADEGGEWVVKSAHTEMATRKGGRKTGSSIQEILENPATGQTKVQHTVYDDTGRIVDGPHPRPNYKPRVDELADPEDVIRYNRATPNDPAP